MKKTISNLVFNQTISNLEPKEQVGFVLKPQESSKEYEKGRTASAWSSHHLLIRRKIAIHFNQKITIYKNLQHNIEHC